MFIICYTEQSRATRGAEKAAGLPCFLLRGADWELKITESSLEFDKGAVNGLDGVSRAHEQRRGTKDISPRLADRAPTWLVAVSYHIGKSDKNVRFPATVVLNL